MLVLDDEPAVARAAARVLRSYDVSVAESPAVGAEQFLRGAFLLVCDLMMPEVDGVEVYRRIARAGVGLEERIVFMTGGVLSAAVQEFLDTRPNPVVQKPFEPTVLRNAVSRVTRPRPR